MPYIYNRGWGRIDQTTLECAKAGMDLDTIWIPDKIDGAFPFPNAKDRIGESPDVKAWLATCPNGHRWCHQCQTWVMPVAMTLQQRWGRSDWTECPTCRTRFSASIGGWWVEQQRAKAEASQRARDARELDIDR